MGMYDDVVVLDESLRCPDGHQLGQFQTKSFSHAVSAILTLVALSLINRRRRD